MIEGFYLISLCSGSMGSLGFGFGMACLRRATFSFRLIGTGTGFSTFLSLYSLSGFRSRLFFFFSSQRQDNRLCLGFLPFTIGCKGKHTVKYSVNVTPYILGSLSGSFVGMLFHVF